MKFFTSILQIPRGGGLGFFMKSSVERKLVFKDPRPVYINPGFMFIFGVGHWEMLNLRTSGRCSSQSFKDLLCFFDVYIVFAL